MEYYHCETIAPDSEPETGTGCDGTDWFNIRKCCRYNGRRCAVGEGDCNKDSECADGLTCGSNNCKRDFSTGETWWGRRHDCCMIDTSDFQYQAIVQILIYRNIYTSFIELAISIFKAIHLVQKQLKVHFLQTRQKRRKDPLLYSRRTQQMHQKPQQLLNQQVNLPVSIIDFYNYNITLFLKYDILAFIF